MAKNKSGGGTVSGLFNGHNNYGNKLFEVFKMETGWTFRAAVEGQEAMEKGRESLEVRKFVSYKNIGLLFAVEPSSVEMTGNGVLPN